MKTLYIDIANKQATFSRRYGEVVCGNTDYQVLFTFDAEWDDFPAKTARFKWNGKHQDITFTGDTCAVPRVSDTALLEVGVYAKVEVFPSIGGESYIAELSTTTPAKIPCLRSILCGTSVETGGDAGDIQLQEKTEYARVNGTYEITPDSGYALSKATVNVSVKPVLMSLVALTNGTYTPTEGCNGFSKVTVNVQGTEPALQEKTATENGEVTPDEGYDGLSKVTVSVPSDAKEEQSKTVSITANGITEITPDSGKVLSSVVVDVLVPTSGETTYTIAAGKYYFSAWYKDPYEDNTEFAEKIDGTLTEDNFSLDVSFNGLWFDYNEDNYYCSIYLLEQRSGTPTAVTDINPSVSSFYITTTADQEVSKKCYEWWQTFATAVDA